MPIFVANFVPDSPMRHRFSLRSLLIWPFVLQTIGTVGLVGYLSFRNGQLAVQKLTTQLQDAGMARGRGATRSLFC
ncbi:MAG: hypothetical protein HC857_12420 [Synechococcales cyanobacterium RU_4_20]|nr:hypothetical protein [Synechococcales cyanobacterium RU_4_20]